MRLTQWAQQPFDRGWTELQQLCTDLIGDDQVAMALEVGMSSGKNGTSRFAQIPLAADQTTLSACCTSEP